MIGIYKITSPTNKIYIGQSINIEKRRDMYINNNCKNQRKLHASLVKYGFNNHVFEIIEECEEHLLNEREEYWIEFYGTFNSKIGMNLSSGGLNKRVSEETKIKISISNKGRKRPDLSIRNSTIIRTLTEEQKAKISERNKSRVHSLETRIKMSESAFKRPTRTKETKLKMSESAKNKVLTKEHKNKLHEWAKSGNSRKKKVVNTSNGKIFNSAKEACLSTKYTYDYFKSMLNGSNKNKTEFKYVGV